MLVQFASLTNRFVELHQLHNAPKPDSLHPKFHVHIGIHSRQANIQLARARILTRREHQRRSLRSRQDGVRFAVAAAPNRAGVVGAGTPTSPDHSATPSATTRVSRSSERLRSERPSSQRGASTALHGGGRISRSHTRKTDHYRTAIAAVRSHRTVREKRAERLWYSASQSIEQIRTRLGDSANIAETPQ